VVVCTFKTNAEFACVREDEKNEQGVRGWGWKGGGKIEIKGR
jgi:hypothetical protein